MRSRVEPVAGSLLAGRYRLGEPLTPAGAGQAYRAHDEVADRPVTIEVLGVGLEDTTMRAVRRQAGAAARLTHPGMARVLDLVEHDDRSWVVTEFIPAPTLEQLVSEAGPLDVRDAAQLGVEILDALLAALSGGVEVRDVRPSTILVTEDGRAVLTGIGVPHAPDRTDPYVSPETARGTRADGLRSDLWSLGATLYAAVEGAPHGLIGSSAAGAIDPVLAGLLAPDPASRPSPEQVEQLLRDVVDGVPVTDLPPVEPSGVRVEASDVAPPVPPSSDETVEMAYPPAVRMQMPLPAPAITPPLPPAENAGTPAPEPPAAAPPDDDLAEAFAVLDAAITDIRTDVDTPAPAAAAPAAQPAQDTAAAADGKPTPPDASADPATRQPDKPTAAAPTGTTAPVEARSAAGTTAPAPADAKPAAPTAPGTTTPAQADAEPAAAPTAPDTTTPAQADAKPAAPTPAGATTPAQPAAATPAAPEVATPTDGKPAAPAAPDAVAPADGERAAATPVVPGAATTERNGRPAPAPDATTPPTQDGKPAAAAEKTPAAENGKPASTGGKPRIGEAHRTVPVVPRPSKSVPVVPAPQRPSPSIGEPKASTPEPERRHPVAPAVPPARRRGRRALIVAASVALLAVLAAGLVAIAGRDDRQTAAPGPTVTAGSGAPTSQTPSPRAPIAAPDGWRLYREQPGFFVAVPNTWRRTADNDTIRWRDPASNRVLSIRTIINPRVDPYDYWFDNMLGTAETEGYEFLRNARVFYRGWPTADWHYRTGPTADRVRTINRLVIPGGQTAYVISFSTADSRWEADRKDFFDTATATFGIGQ